MDRAAGEPRQPTRPSRPPTGPAGEELPYDVAKVLSSFFKDDRLVTIPARERKRLVVLRYLRDRVFTEDRAYPEAEVNQRLALFNRDVAALPLHGRCRAGDPLRRRVPPSGGRLGSALAPPAPV